MSDPSPDLFDICVVLNEATDAPLGANLLPYAERCKAIVIEALAAEVIADARQERIRDGLDPDGSTMGDLFIPAKGGTVLSRYDVADWLRAHLGGTEATDDLRISVRCENVPGTSA